MRSLPLAALFVISLAATAAPQRAVTLEVRNMTCALCPITVRKSLEQVSGVVTVRVDLGKKTATVTYDPEKVGPDALTRATANAGYPSTVQD